MPLALGCDLGALATKTVLLADGELISHDITRNEGMLADVAESSLARVLEKTDIRFENIPDRGGTGWGGKYITYPHHPETLINCISAGAYWHRPSARTVVDLGGLSTTVIGLNDRGKVLEYRNNDRCASGTGFFVELVAQALELELEDLDRVARSALGKANIGAQCAVFGESEIVSHINDGIEPADILAGVAYAIGAGTATTVRRLGIVPEVVVTGGVVKLGRVVDALSEKLDIEVTRPEVDSQLLGAVGAALCAARRDRKPFEAGTEVSK